MAKFQVGDVVRLRPAEEFWDNKVFNQDHIFGIDFGLDYLVEEVGGNIKLEGVKGFWMEDRFDLAVLPAVPVLPPVAFLFVQEQKPGKNNQDNIPFVIAKQIEISFHASLEAAEERRGQLSLNIPNVHTYMRIEE